ncbi:MAG: PHB depolymerase family esterase [Caldilineaceae bacterium]
MTSAQQHQRIATAARQGRLQARPAPPTARAALGTQALGLDATKDALLYLPAGYQPAEPAPLAVMCHGAGGKADHGLNILQYLADETGLILLAPASRSRTWDMLMDDYGPDIALLDEALAATFARCTVDPERIAIGGFSDGASYALSVGIMNGDLFSHILAFSPGFMAPLIQRDTPAIFISHGIEDGVLPINRCSRQIVPQLMEAGYEVRYQEFDDRIRCRRILREAVMWFVGG